MAVADRIQIATVNDLAGVTLTSDETAETAYPLTNVQNENSGQPAIWDASGSPADLVIEWTGATAITFNCLAITGIDWPDDNTVKLELFADAAHTGTEQDSGTLSVVRQGTNKKEQFIYCFDSFAAKSGRITITTPSYTNSQIVIDKIFMGLAHVFTYGIERASKFWTEEKSTHTPKPGGGVETYVAEARRRASLIFKGSETTELKTIQDMLELAKKGGDIFVGVDPADTEGLRHKRSGIYRRNNDWAPSSRYYNGHDYGIDLIES